MSYINIREFIRLVIKEDVEKLDSAQILSQYAHRDQKRRSGEPYFLHPQEVANIVSRYYNDTGTYYTALLHDAIEDGIPLGNIEDEDTFFDLLISEIPENNIKLADKIYNSVIALTKKGNEEYSNYIIDLTNDVYAFRVKLADIMQNISDNPSDKQILKYVKAKDLLLQKFGKESPTGISNQHWLDFQNEIEKAKNP